MLTRETINNLTFAHLKAEIRSRGGYLRESACCPWYLRNYLWLLREVEPNVVYVPPKKRRNGVTKPDKAAAAPVPVVQAAAPVQVVQTAAPVPVVQAVVPVQVVQELDIPTPPSTPIAIRVFGFSPRADKWE